MEKTDLTARSIAAFIDLLIIIGLVRLPDVLGFLSAMGYLLFRDGLFGHQSAGKRLIGLRVVPSEGSDTVVSYRGSIMRNVTFAVAFLLFLVPVAGWVLCPLALAIEGLTALGDERGMRVGDIIARTVVVAAAPAGTMPDKKHTEPAGDTPPDEPAGP